MKWFTSDTHFGHRNVIDYDHRPFGSIEEHDEALITNWNTVVQPGDVVYHLGDFGFESTRNTEIILANLNGVKHLIKGNHDTGKITRAKGWSSVQDYHEISENGQKVVLFHYRMVTWHKIHLGSWALHGHSHGNLPINLEARTFDVGTMLWGYRPISLAEVGTEMLKYSFVPTGKEYENLFKKEMK